MTTSPLDGSRWGVAANLADSGRGGGVLLYRAPVHHKAEKVIQSG